MHQNTPNYDSNIHFGPPWSPGGGLGGSKSKFDPRRGFFAPNQKVQKTKYVFICPINITELELGQHFEIGTLSPPSIHSGLKWGVRGGLFDPCSRGG